MHVVREHEVVGPEQQLGQQRGRGARQAVADQPAGLAGLGGQLREASRLPPPQEPRRSGGERPRSRVREHGGRDRLVHRPERQGQGDPRDRLARPVDVQRVPHDLQAARSPQVHLAERDEGQRQCAGAKGTRRGVRVAPREGVGQRAREQEQRGRHDDARDRGDGRRPPQDAPRTPRLTAAGLDGDPAHRGHVHPEARPRPRHERELRRERHQAQRSGPARAEPAKDEDVDRERGEDVDREPGHVLAGSRQKRQAIVIRGSQGRGGAPPPPPPRPRRGPRRSSTEPPGARGRRRRPPRPLRRPR